MLFFCHSVIENDEKNDLTLEFFIFIFHAFNQCCKNAHFLLVRSFFELPDKMTQMTVKLCQFSYLPLQVVHAEFGCLSYLKMLINCFTIFFIIEQN